MKIAVCSDEKYAVHDQLTASLRARGYEIQLFGALVDGRETPWVEVAAAAADAVRSGQCEQGVFCCWTGTGISMAANKLHGIRAALCTDAETARGARKWNDANVLCLSNRLLGEHLLEEILESWFEASVGEEGAVGIQALAELDAAHRRRDSRESA